MLVQLEETVEADEVLKDIERVKEQVKDTMF